MSPLRFRQFIGNQWHFWGMQDDGSFTGPSSLTSGGGIAPSQQSTGLKDKNGEEIFEGDLLLEEWFGHHGRTYVHEVRWSVFGWGLSKNGRKDSVTCFTGGLHHQDSFDVNEYKLEYFTIIGNIYENPELLPPAK